MKRIVLFILLVCGFANLKAQELPVYNHYFVYPNLYNPSFLGLSEYAEVTLLHRQQWVGIDGAPVVSNIGLQMPLNDQMAVGFNVGNTESGLLTTTIANGSFAYTIPLNNQSYFSFGVNLGAGRQSIDVDQINDLSDPAIAGALDKSFFLTGQAGLMLQYNRLNIGFSLPNIFENQIFSDDNFQEVGFDALRTTVSSVKYNFELSPFLNFEPSVLFISDQVTDSQFRGAGTFYIKDIVWIGGIYGEQSGASVFGGVNVNNSLKIGYSYDLNPPQVSGFSNGTHEFYLKFRFGRKKANRRGSPSEELLATSLPTETSTEEIPEETITEETPEEKAEQVSEPNLKKEKRNRKKNKDIDKDDAAVSQPSETTTDKLVKEENNELKKAEIEGKANTGNGTEIDADKNISSTIPKEETDQNSSKNGITENSDQDKKPMKVPSFSQKEEESTPEPINDFEKEHNVVRVSKGDESEELAKGYYVVVGAFQSKQNAKNYRGQLSNANYASKIGFNSKTQLNYVYIASSDLVQDIVGLKDEYRQKSEFQFEDTWILKID